MGYFGADKVWYLQARNNMMVCPSCRHDAKLSAFIEDGSTPINYLGFTNALCPNCLEILIFDLEEMQLNRWGEGRKPPLLLLGTGRYLDFALAAVAVYLLITGRMIALPLVFVIALGFEIGWELIVRRENPDWYHTDMAFSDATDIMARIGLPMTIVRLVVALLAIYILAR